MCTMVHNSNNMGQHLKQQQNNGGDGGEIIGLMDMCEMCNLSLLECYKRRRGEKLCCSGRQPKKSKF